MVDENYLLNTVECPPKSHFNSRLNESQIDDEDYKAVKKNWRLHNFKNMLECVGYYVLQDVVWLAEVWTAFAECAHKAFGLSIDHYWTLPSFAYGRYFFFSSLI